MAALSALLVLPAALRAQTKALEYTTVDPTFETGGRLSVGLDWAIVPKKLSLKLEEEVRLTDNFSTLKRSYTTLGLEGKVLPWMKVGVGASFIMNQSPKGEWTPRFRPFAEVTLSTKADRWKLSLRERLHSTYNSSVNVYQEPMLAWALKSRVKVSYDIRHSPLTPYASAELRTTLNAVNPAYFVYTTSDGRWAGTSPVYNDVYINRLRLSAGVTCKTKHRNELDIFLVSDLNWDLDIDFNSSGKQKKDSSYSSGYAPYLFLEDSCFLGIGISYTFKL